MDFARLGTILRAVRIKKRWRQEDVALRAGVTRAAVSRLERGHARDLGVDDVLRIAEALDVVIRLAASWRGGELDRLLNARHSALHEAVARWLTSLAGWQLAPEVSFSVFGERGVIDILAWHEATGTLLVIELKTEIVDVNDLMGRLDVKRRHAISIARERGWNAKRAAVWAVVAESSTNRRRVNAHKTTLHAAFPANHRAVASWVTNPVDPIRALWFWSNARLETTNESFATIKRVRRPVSKAA